MYGLNTFGAMIGAGMGGLVFIPLLGMNRSLILTGLINIGVGLCAFYFCSGSTESDVEERIPEEVSQPSPTENGDWGRRVLLWAYFLSGFTSLSCEIVWTRGLILSFGSSIYAFTIVFMTFLGGLAGGSLLFNRFFNI